MVRDIFIFNMRNRDAQNELCREVKTPEEALRFAMSYERGDMYAKIYKGNASGSTGTVYPSPGGSLQIKTEPINKIRGSRGRGMPRGRGQYPNRGGGGGGGGGEIEHKNECKNGYLTIAISRTSRQNTDKRCPARAVTCNFCKKSRAI